MFDDDTALKVIKRCKPNSRATAYYALKFIYNAYGEELGLQHSDVVPKSVRKHKEILLPDEVNQIIDRVRDYEPPHVQFLFVLATVYGLRRVEIYRLEKGDIDLKRETFFVFTAKGGEPREHIIHDIVKPYFKKFMEIKKPKYRFIQELNMLFDVIADRAEVELRPRLGWHSIRRCLITELMKTNVNPMIIRDFLRWKPRTSDILMEYTLYNPAEVDKMIFDVHPFLGRWKVTNY